MKNHLHETAGGGADVALTGIAHGFSSLSGKIGNINALADALLAMQERSPLFWTCLV